MSELERGRQFSRRTFLFSFTASVALLRRPRADAHARAMSFDDVLSVCDCCVAGRSLAADSEWWTLAGKRRIVTVHRFAVSDVIAGEVASGDELLVRTLGGVIGDYGERVIGEAELRVDARSLVLLTASSEPGVHVVSGMEHGHFLLERDPEGVERLRAPRRAHNGASPTARLEGESLRALPALLTHARGSHAR